MNTYEIVSLFVFGLILLIKGGDWFVDGACGIAKKFHLPEILIGATVVSIGTTLPEVMVSAGAALKGTGDVAYGNAIGSIICNTALVSAITIAVRPTNVQKKTLLLPVAFFFVAAVFYCVCALTLKRFSRVVGIVLLCLFVVYMVLTVWRAVKAKDEDKLPLQTASTENGEGAKSDDTEEKSRPFLLNLLLLVIGAGLIAWGADLLVDNGILLAEKMGVPSSVIALTFVALGTSLPELVTAITSLLKGHSSLSLGNIIGANLFNLVLVSGLAATVGPFAVPSSKLLFGINASFVVDLPVMFGVMLLMTLPPLLKGKLYRFQGITLLLVYASYICFQFAL